MKMKMKCEKCLKSFHFSSFFLSFVRWFIIMAKKREQNRRQHDNIIAQGMNISKTTTKKKKCNSIHITWFMLQSAHAKKEKKRRKQNKWAQERKKKAKELEEHVYTCGAQRWMKYTRFWHNLNVKLGFHKHNKHNFTCVSTKRLIYLINSHIGNGSENVQKNFTFLPGVLAMGKSE